MKRNPEATKEQSKKWPMKEMADVGGLAWRKHRPTRNASLSYYMLLRAANISSYSMLLASNISKEKH
jgi:hypothetical protein